jgi:hypothetical protein
MAVFIAKIVRHVGPCVTWCATVKGPYFAR